MTTENAASVDGVPSAAEDLNLPSILSKPNVRSLHASISCEWEPLRLSACQTAAGRALWRHAVGDPLAEVLAGETFLRSLHEKMRRDILNNAREVSGVVLAVRTLWFDSRIEAAVGRIAGKKAQVVLIGAGMDARAYRMGCLNGIDVFELDFPDLLETKIALLREALTEPTTYSHVRLHSRSLIRVAADVREGDWLHKLKINGFSDDKTTIWVLEGFLYYLTQANAVQVLKSISSTCSSSSPAILIADFMNKSSISLSIAGAFQFYCDWPENLLPKLGFSDVKISQIGDPDTDFGLLKDPQNLFNKVRNLPRTVEENPEDGSPCTRLFLVEAWGFNFIEMNEEQDS